MSWGSGVDDSIWAKLAYIGDVRLRHELWTCVIRAVGRSVVLRRRNLPPWASVSDSIDEETEHLIMEWQNKTLPIHCDLAWVDGIYEYFRDIDMSWDEKISFAGPACGYPSDAVYGLSCCGGCLSWCFYLTPEAITEESVEDFYLEWRSRFLRRVLNEASALTGRHDSEE
jgi:hypothetical protein